MPPPTEHPALTLRLLEGTFVVDKVDADQSIPARWTALLASPPKRDEFLSITRTEEEISMVCDAARSGQLQSNGPLWRCIRIKGPMDFGLTGVMCNFTAPLKEAAIPVFAISTWNTDYILVPEKKIEPAMTALKDDGWTFDS